MFFERERTRERREFASPSENRRKERLQGDVPGAQRPRDEAVVNSAHARARLLGQAREYGFEKTASRPKSAVSSPCETAVVSLPMLLGCAAFEFEFGIIQPPRLAVEASGPREGS